MKKLTSEEKHQLLVMLLSDSSPEEIEKAKKEAHKDAKTSNALQEIVRMFDLENDGWFMSRIKKRLDGLLEPGDFCYISQESKLIWVYGRHAKETHSQVMRRVLAHKLMRPDELIIRVDLVEGNKVRMLYLDGLMLETEDASPILQPFTSNNDRIPYELYPSYEFPEIAKWLYRTHDYSSPDTMDLYSFIEEHHLPSTDYYNFPVMTHEFDTCIATGKVLEMLELIETNFPDSIILFSN